MRKFQAFTLIELLVVISIISLLISILLPALGAARKAATAARCLTNLRQIRLSSQLYSSDYDDLLLPAYIGPTGNTSTNWWIYKIQPYINAGGLTDDISILRCPSWENFPNNMRYYSYAINRYTGYIDGNGDGQDGYPDRLEQLARPSDVFHFADGNAAQSGSRWSWRFFSYPSNSTNKGRLIDIQRHTNGANIVYADGHGNRTKLPAEIDATLNVDAFEKHYLWQ